MNQFLLKNEEILVKYCSCPTDRLITHCTNLLLQLLMPSLFLSAPSQPVLLSNYSVKEPNLPDAAIKDPVTKS